MLKSLPVPCLCLVTDLQHLDIPTMVDRIYRAVLGGVDLIQIREKTLPDKDLLELALLIVDRLDGSAQIVVNDRINISKQCGLGVHLPEASESILDIKKLLETDALIGKSVHNIENAVIAEEQGVGFLIAGTMFSTESHPGKIPEGPLLIDNIRQVGDVSIPVLGIGGITAGNADLVMQSGASGVAVISSILKAPDPMEAAAAIKQVISRSLIV